MLHNRKPGAPLDPNPCLSCGACCATFRVSFFWGELESHGGPVPDALVTEVTPFRVAMCGTTAHPSRCVALEGAVGGAVSCTIHPQRPTPCREFAASGEDGQPQPRCEEARAAHGLPPLCAPPA